MDLTFATLPTPLSQIFDEKLESAGVRVFVKRDDLVHPIISGNKWRKLKYNLLDAKTNGYYSLLTFGGSYSNHLAATAAAGRLFDFQTFGMVRGEDHEINDTPTLQFCRDQGMHLQFVSRQEYKLRNTPDYLDMVKQKFPDSYLIPEGGTSLLALPGIAEMVAESIEQLGFAPTYFAVSSGTGGTAAGILAAGQDVLAFSALKGGVFLKQDIGKLLQQADKAGSLNLFTEYHFGGYAKWNHELLDFIGLFKKEHGIQLEQVYTAKMFYGLFDLIGNNYFPTGTTIVAVHTGGLQGLLPTLS